MLSTNHAGMRVLLPVVVLISLAVAAPIQVGAGDAGEVRITRVWTRYREAHEFVRLSEYFSGKENTGSAIVLRSQPGQRDGFYFTVRVDASGGGTLESGRVVVHIVAPDSDKPRTFDLPFETKPRHSLRFEIGVTGSDWKYGKSMPLAWKLEFFDSSGKPLASEQSFLWEKPAAAGT